MPLEAHTETVPRAAVVAAIEAYAAEHNLDPAPLIAELADQHVTYVRISGTVIIASPTSTWRLDPKPSPPL